jgi:hypothetical protein
MKTSKNELENVAAQAWTLAAAGVYNYDMESRLMLSKNINSNCRNAQLELSQIPAGVYYVLLMNNERAERTKISVIK